MWAFSVAFQGVSRNTNICVGSTITQTAGPATKMLLYETTVGMMNASVSGITSITGVRSAGGKYLDYITPLEHKFAGEVYKACAGMSREQANKIAQAIIPKYEEQLHSPPKGQSIHQCYNIDTLEPSKEWATIYDTVKAEVREIGIPLD